MSALWYLTKVAKCIVIVFYIVILFKHRSMPLSTCTPHGAKMILTERKWHWWEFALITLHTLLSVAFCLQCAVSAEKAYFSESTNADSQHSLKSKVLLLIYYNPPSDGTCGLDMAVKMKYVFFKCWHPVWSTYKSIIGKEWWWWLTVDDWQWRECCCIIDRAVACPSTNTRLLIFLIVVPLLELVAKCLG